MKIVSETESTNERNPYSLTLAKFGWELENSARAASAYLFSFVEFSKLIDDFFSDNILTIGISLPVSTRGILVSEEAVNGSSISDRNAAHDLYPLFDISPTIF